MDWATFWATSSRTHRVTLGAWALLLPVQLLFSILGFFDMTLSRVKKACLKVITTKK
jgi:hypothetical protein